MCVCNCWLGILDEQPRRGTARMFKDVCLYVSVGLTTYISTSFCLGLFSIICLCLFVYLCVFLYSSVYMCPFIHLFTNLFICLYRCLHMRELYILLRMHFTPLDVFDAICEKKKLMKMFPTCSKRQTFVIFFSMLVKHFFRFSSMSSFICNIPFFLSWMIFLHLLVFLFF